MKVIKHDETIKKLFCGKHCLNIFFILCYYYETCLQLTTLTTVILYPSHLIIKFENISELGNHCEVRR